MSTEQQTIVLGNEFDSVLRDKVLAVLKGMNAITVDSDWIMAGSQEVELVEFQINERSLFLESETYIGLSVRGDAEDLRILTDLLLV
jgi:hypothetical protein